MEKMIKKSAISLISYDAEYLPASIKTYYNLRSTLLKPLITSNDF